MFREKEDHIGLSNVYEAMSRKEFENLKSFIHFADNNALDTNEKFSKVRSLCDIMKKILKQFGFYSIDEQMKPYNAKNSSKKTIHTKSVGFGYKNFVLCSPAVYPYFIDPYCGAKVEEKYQRTFVVNQLFIA